MPSSKQIYIEGLTSISIRVLGGIKVYLIKNNNQTYNTFTQYEVLNKVYNSNSIFEIIQY